MSSNMHVLAMDIFSTYSRTWIDVMPSLCVFFFPFWQERWC